MGFAHHIASDTTELTGGWTSARPPVELPGRVVGGAGAEAHLLEEPAFDAFDCKIAGTLASVSPYGASAAPAGVATEISGAEARVLRYLPTSLSAREIAAELWLSANTVKTHMRHLYAKLDAHTRREAVDKARASGLLATRKRTSAAHVTGTFLRRSTARGFDLGAMR